MFKKMMISILLFGLIAINAVLWPYLYSMYKGSEGQKETKQVQQVAGDSLAYEEDGIKERQQECQENHMQYYFDIHNGHYRLHIIDEEKEIVVKLSDTMDEIRNKLGAPNDAIFSQGEFETLDYQYENGLTIGFDPEKKTILSIHMPFPLTVEQEKWFSTLGAPMNSVDNKQFKGDLQYLKFEKHENQMFAYLFEDYMRGEEITTDNPDVAANPVPEQSNPYKTLADTIYPGDIIKIGPFSVSNGGYKSTWVLAEIQPLIGEAGYVPYGKGGTLPTDIFGPFVQYVRSEDLDFWLDIDDGYGFELKPGDGLSFSLYVRVAPSPRFDTYHLDGKIALRGFAGSSGDMTIRHLRNLTIKISK